MAKDENGKWGWNSPGRRPSVAFDRVISPLGENCVEDPAYSPSRTVESAKAQGHGKARQSYSAREQRRS